MIIKDTITLSKNTQIRYVNKLLKNNVFIFNEYETPVVTKAFLQVFNSMEDFDLTEMIKKATCNDEFLTKMVRLGGCLIAFNVPRSELFHSLNIVAYMIGFPNCSNLGSKNILEWIDRCFPPNIIKKALLLKSGTENLCIKI